MSLRPGVLYSTKATALAGLAILLAISVASCSGDDADDVPPVTATGEETPTPSPNEATDVLPTPPPGLTARFLDPAAVMPSEVPPAQYEAYTDLVEDLISDVGEFWAEWFERERQETWSEPELVERIPGTPIVCNDVDVQNVRGSFYCPPEDYVVFEENEQLLPLYLQVGPHSVAMVISHEFGHSVQRSLGIEYSGTDEQELQADCFAGMWFRHYQESGGFDDPEQPFLQAYAAMRTVSNGRDLLDRFDALSDGYLEGIQPCLDLVPSDEAEAEPTS
ncbi:MAG TPA: neutral zinc metallopeptidase [Dehalococcoidia bacterium]|nr:neutral zinc metallopeptidase [Dehalococcoidia bacterium]